MKILYHHRIRSRDGQSVHLEELIAAFRQLGHSVRLVGPRAFERSAFGSEPARLQSAKSSIPPALYELLELGYNLIAFPRLIVAAIRFRPEFIYERYNLYSLAGVCVSRLLGLPLLLEINAPLAVERKEHGGLAFSGLARILENWIWRTATAVLPVTGVLADQVRGARVPECNIHIIPNAIDVGRFENAPAPVRSKESLGLAGKVVVGFIGFARPWHGLERIVELLARPEAPPDLHALIVGEGPAIEQLKLRARSLSVSRRVTFVGLVDRAKIPLFLSALDIALIPNCVEYCSPLKLFEYMALAKPVVAPDQPNIREILADGRSALLFPPQTPALMAAAVLRLAADPGLRERLGGAAKLLINSRGFTWEQNARRVVELAQRITGAKGEPVTQ